MTRALTDRDDLHRVAAHVLARRRQAVSGRIGLRATPGGIGTPAFGPDAEVVRLAGDNLVHETTSAATMPLDGSTLRQLAAFVGEDIDRPIDLGKDTPAVGDPDAPIRVATGPLAAWFHRAWVVLDALVADARAAESGEHVGDASVIQIWPEHFDAAVDVAAGAGRANLGASPGDGFQQAPYFYVGPWDAARPGPPGYWNAPFGAVMDGDVDDDAGVIAWMREGLSRLGT